MLPPLERSSEEARTGENFRLLHLDSPVLYAFVEEDVLLISWGAESLMKHLMNASPFQQASFYIALKLIWTDLWEPYLWYSSVEHASFWHSWPWSCRRRRICQSLGMSWLWTTCTSSYRNHETRKIAERKGLTVRDATSATEVGGKLEANTGKVG